MGHTPFGYRIKNGIAVIDEESAAKLRRLYENYLSGMSLKNAAAKAGIETYHGTAKRLLMTKHYLGDDFYPAIIDKSTFSRAQEELMKRASALGRLNKATSPRSIKIPTFFSIRKVEKHYDNPAAQAEYCCRRPVRHTPPPLRSPG